MNRTHWNDFKWRLIHAAPQPPSLHMALDEVLTDEVAAGRMHHDHDTDERDQDRHPAAHADPLVEEEMCDGADQHRLGRALRPRLW